MNMEQNKVNNRHKKRLNLITHVEFNRLKYGENKIIQKKLRYKHEPCFY